MTVEVHRGSTHTYKPQLPLGDQLQVFLARVLAIGYWVRGFFAALALVTLLELIFGTVFGFLLGLVFGAASVFLLLLAFEWEFPCFFGAILDY